MNRRALIQSMLAINNVDVPEDFLIVKSNKNIHLGFYRFWNVQRGEPNITDIFASFDKGVTWINLYDETHMEIDISEDTIYTMSYASSKEIWLYGTSKNGMLINDFNVFSLEEFNLRYEVDNDTDEGLIIEVEGDLMNLVLRERSLTKRTTAQGITGVFRDWKHLINSPAISATKIFAYAFSFLFEGCTSLVNAPELPATTLADKCYLGMFKGCTSLVNAPELPATTLADNCYYRMFEGCTSLVNAPELPATTLARGCYDLMFKGCTSLTSITMYYTGNNTSFTYMWVGGVNTVGTLYKAGTQFTVSGDNTYPGTWTQVQI